MGESQASSLYGEGQLTVLDENHQILNKTKDMLVQRGYQIKECPKGMKENENADQFMPEILQLSMSCR